MDDQRDERYLGLTATQFNLAFLAVIGAVALGAAIYFGVIDVGRGDKQPSSAAVVGTATPVATATPSDREAPPPASVAEFEKAPCQFRVPPGPLVECGYLVVPEDHWQPEGPTIRLHVAILRTMADDPAPDPIVYLDGGPGASPLKTAQLGLGGFAQFLMDRDLILLDQRGVGYSEPALNCHDFKELSFRAVEEQVPADQMESLAAEATSECRDRLLRRAVSLSAYTSAQSAADLNGLRQALGYDEWNLYGVSYGTRLALTAMRDYPAGIRSVVLDSTYPLQADLYAELPANATRAFKLLFDSNPGLEAEFFDLVEELNETPVAVPIDVVDPFTLNHLNSAFIDGDGLITMLFQSLYVSEFIPYLPDMIHGIRDRDLELLGSIAESYLSGISLISDGMHFSVQCGEEVPFSSRQEGSAAAEVYPEVQNWADSDPFLTVCQSWGVAAANPIENEPVVSDIRTLILAGEYDPITPPAWGRLVADNLANSFYFEFPDIGHGVALSGPCALDMTLAFFDDPTAEPDGSCR